MELLSCQDYERLFSRVDRSGGPSTPNGKLLKKSWTTNANDGIPYARSAMPFYGSIEPGHNGENLINWPTPIRPGRPYTTTFGSSNSGVYGRTAGAEELLDNLVVKERKRQQREATPSLLAIDSQSVKIMQFITEETGIDAHKLINGRKRSIAVDRLGLPWSLAVTSANTSDNEAGRLVIDRLKGKVPRLKLIAADHGYKVSFIAHAEVAGYQTEIVQIGPPKRPESSRGFVPQKNRWPVERSFGWLNFRRRLFRDVEKTIESSEAMLRIAFFSFIINRL